MAGGGEKKGNDFYAVLGLDKECTSTELRNAYKKLAMRWHPDRCSASGNSKFVEEAKKNFQAIQEAYAVLSDETKRFLYDVGVYDNDDEDNNNGMGDFLNEMVAMMSENKPSENKEESFEQLQELFDEMFQTDVCDGHTPTSASQGSSSTASCSSSYIGSFESFCVNGNGNYKRTSAEMNNNAEGSSSSFSAHFQSFCAGAEQCRGDPRKGKGRRGETLGRADSNINNNSNSIDSRRRQGRKQKVSSGHDVSSNDYRGISA